MTDTPVLPPRPDPPRRLGDAASAWLAWFGPGRLAISAVSMIVVSLGVVWLVRAPSPPTEAGLPFTSGPSTSTGATTGVPGSAGTSAPTVATISPTMLVHVAGSVVTPGVYSLGAGARVEAAIAAAGGPTPEADLDGLNLASALADGQRVYVPITGEVDPETVPSGGIAADEAAGETPSSGPVDLNEASIAELETLPGVGPATAAAIVDDRERNGPFASVAELERVPGIGPAKLAAVADLVTV